MSPNTSSTEKERRSDSAADREISQLTAELDKLQVRRSSIISELKAVDLEHTKVEQKIRLALSRPRKQLEGKDSKGNTLSIGDNVTTLTKGKYYERIATVVDIRPDNHIDIAYKTSGLQTWRAGHNLLKLN